MLGILIDPFTWIISQIDLDVPPGNDSAELAAIRSVLFHEAHVGERHIEGLDVDDAGHCMFLDEEGMLRNRDAQAFFRFRGQLLAGRGLILGSTEDGYCADCTLTVPQVARLVSWMLPSAMSNSPRARYDWTLLGSVVCVIDRDELGSRSVTNDAEAVVDDLRALGLLVPGRRLIYRDSMGYWDEMVLADGHFTGFRSLGARHVAEALQLLRDGRRRQ